MLPFLVYLWQAAFWRIKTINHHLSFPFTWPTRFTTENLDAIFPTAPTISLAISLQDSFFRVPHTFPTPATHFVDFLVYVVLPFLICLSLSSLPVWGLCCHLVWFSASCTWTFLPYPLSPSCHLSFPLYDFLPSSHASPAPLDSSSFQTLPFRDFGDNRWWASRKSQWHQKSYVDISRMCSWPTSIFALKKARAFWSKRWQDFSPFLAGIGEPLTVHSTASWEASASGWMKSALPAAISRRGKNIHD